MSKFLKFSILGLTAAFAFTLTFVLSPCARAQDDAQTDVTGPTFSESLVFSFTGNAGAEPGQQPYYGNLIQASDGNFYGTASEGGTDTDGTVYKLTPAGVFTLLHTFTGTTTDGSTPFGGLIQGTDGNFYGTTLQGGASGNGTIYKITSSGVFSLLYSFVGGSTDGSNPESGLVQGTDGNFYGTAFIGGVKNLGEVYTITPSGDYTVLHFFAGGTTDGRLPYGGLVQGTDGNFYGLTYQGGTSNDGVAYKITSGGAVTLLHSFTDNPDGRYTQGGLMQATDGNFYGTTYEGGSSVYGTVFQMTPAGAVTILHNFTNATTDGGLPVDTLVQGTDGQLYGTTYFGGANGDGTVFSMTLGGAFTLLHSFSTATTDGYRPFDGLVQGLDGNFYGADKLGGADTDGTVYKMTASPALAAPVQLTAPVMVATGSSFTLSYLVTNATSDTMKQCFATNNAGDATVWTGIKTGATTATNAMLTASSTGGTYTYTLTCGGAETGAVNVIVMQPPTITFTSVTHNFGSSTVGTAATSYGVQVKNTSTMAYPYSLVFTPAHGFTSATNCPASIAAGAVCQLEFYFTPAATGTVTDAWSLAPVSGFAYSPSNGGTLTGSGTASTSTVTLTTNGHNFGTVSDGTTSPAYSTELTNGTSSAVTLTRGSVSAPFTALTNCGATLAAGSSCELAFTFKPTTPGIVQKVYALSSSGPGITAGGAPLPNGGVTLTGTGQ
jgi:uncharacterized repeat protein (TIGR03803 family)